MNFDIKNRLKMDQEKPVGRPGAWYFDQNTPQGEECEAFVSLKAPSQTSNSLVFTMVLQGGPKTADLEHIEVRIAVDSSFWSKNNKSQKMAQKRALQNTSKMNLKMPLKNEEAARGLPKVAKPF